MLGWYFAVKLGWTSILVPFVGNLEIGIVGVIAVFAFAVVATSNAVNITDGLDGLAGGLGGLAEGAGCHEGSFVGDHIAHGSKVDIDAAAYDHAFHLFQKDAFR